ncbi:hypothetical protein DSLASN_14960 [Desulfoluna limicola]|uniref:Uncharacterized protein n=1 Tax=Desulfoluna limicola TaxID=2810562 RepID=A0ABM7PFB9_9BACT|nr:hypothetical protein [Desulfoluna limicola]BCS95864.1 hypothetical protein DSLASN_14960 [Desulfoluna limicola]
MNLKYALKQVGTNVIDINGYSVSIIKDYEKITQDLPIEEFQIYKIDIDDDDCEITLITDEKSKSLNIERPLLAMEVFEQLNVLMPKFKDYILFSGSSHIELDKDYWGRIDTPLIAMGFDHESKNIAFVQEGNTNS